ISGRLAVISASVSLRLRTDVSPARLTCAHHTPPKNHIDCRQKAKGQKSLQMSHRRRQSSMTTIRLLRSRSARVRFAAALTWDHVPKCLIYDLRAETAEEYGQIGR